MNAPFAEIPLAPPDPILGLTEVFLKDPNPNKVNLGVGVYQNGKGVTPLLDSVKVASQRVLEKESSKSYLPIDGLKEFNRAIQELIFGAESEVISAGRVLTCQSVAGSGALSLGAQFLRRYANCNEIWISSPSWDNHRTLFEGSGLEVKSYNYYDAKNNNLDYAAMMQSLSQLPRGAAVLFHACCHNPTGVDLARSEWFHVLELVQQRSLLPFIDLAYQGFSQSPEDDAFAARLFAEAEVPCIIAHSCSKIFGLYRERIGSLSIVCKDSEEAARVLSQVKRIVRMQYSSPPAYGAQVVAEIMQDQDLRTCWKVELKEMRERIQNMRSLLVETLASIGVKQDFDFIKSQCGMFSYSGLSEALAERLREEFSVYILRSGRMCVAALNDKNVGYVAEAIAKVLKN